MRGGKKHSCSGAFLIFRNKKKLLLWTAAAALLGAAPAMAGTACPYYGGHIDMEGKVGSKRHIAETGVFLPVACTEETLLFTDLRFRWDNQDNSEGNIGLGVRRLRATGVAGAYIYADRKKSGVTDKYHNQATVGAEWLTDSWETRVNMYVPLSGEKTVGSGVVQGNPYLAGSGIYVDRQGFSVREEGLYGGDVEGGFKLPDSRAWFYGGAFVFSSEHADTIVGGRARARYEINDNFALTAEGQYDDERGRQGWIGVRVTVPFGGGAAKKGGAAHRARMTASPVRDVDIVTATQRVSVGAVGPQLVVNEATGKAQRVLYVDNTAAAGDGTKERPFNSLAAAQAALQAHDTLYIASGAGTANMTTGLTIDKQGVTVIGEGTAFTYQGFTLKPAGVKPVISNATGDGVTVTASNVTLTGFNVTGAAHDGIVVRADNIVIDDARIVNVGATGNRIGLYLHGLNGGSLTAAVESASLTGNSQHGVAVYDDTSGTFDIDLGGGGRSAGLNALRGNTLEDLAVDYDGRTLSARNNWWGQAGGPYQAAPAGGLKPQIYYGAPVNDGLVGHWTFDTEWMAGTTAYDRSGNGNDGTMFGGLTTANTVAGRYRQGLTFDGVNDNVRLPASNALVPGDQSFSMVTSFSTTQLYNTGLNEIGGRLFVLRRGVGSTKVANLLYGNNQDDMGLFYFNGGNSVRIATDTNYNDGAFRNLTSTYDSVSNMAGVYVDSQTAGLVNAGTIVASSAHQAVIGMTDPGTNDGVFRGVIDEVRLYNRALTPEEAGALNRMSTNSIVDTGP